VVVVVVELEKLDKMEILIIIVLVVEEEMVFKLILQEQIYIGQQVVVVHTIILQMVEYHIKEEVVDLVAVAAAHLRNHILELEAQVV